MARSLRGADSCGAWQVAQLWWLATRWRPGSIDGAWQVWQTGVAGRPGEAAEPCERWQLAQGTARPCGVAGLSAWQVAQAGMDDRGAWGAWQLAQAW